MVTICTICNHHSGTKHTKVLRPRFFCANAFSRTGYTYVNFVPTLDKTAVDGDVKDILILNTSGTLVHPSATGDMKGFRGYFLMHDAPAGAREFIMNFGDGETNGIQPIRMENGTTPAEGTYDLSGRRIQGQPTQKGVYIQNGKKVIIK